MSPEQAAGRVKALRRYLDSIVKDYEKSSKDDVHGYSDEGGFLGFGGEQEATTKPLPHELKAYLDQHVLEGKLKSSIKEDSTLSRIAGDIDRRLTEISRTTPDQTPARDIERRP